MNFKPLTPDEVKRAYAFARQEAQPGSLLVYLLADLDRLRALVKASEFPASRTGRWCCHCLGPSGGHTADCPAFTPEGEVR